MNIQTCKNNEVAFQASESYEINGYLKTNFLNIWRIMAGDVIIKIQAPGFTVFTPRTNYINIEAEILNLYLTHFDYDFPFTLPSYCFPHEYCRINNGLFYTADYARKQGLNAKYGKFNIDTSSPGIDKLIWKGLINIFDRQFFLDDNNIVESIKNDISKSISKSIEKFLKENFFLYMSLMS